MKITKEDARLIEFAFISDGTMTDTERIDLLENVAKRNFVVPHHWHKYRRTVVCCGRDVCKVEKFFEFRLAIDAFKNP